MVDREQPPATHEDPQRDFGAGRLGWSYMAAAAPPVAGLFVFGLVGLIVGLIVGAGVFFALRAMTS